MPDKIPEWEKEHIQISNGAICLCWCNPKVIPNEKGDAFVFVHRDSENQEVKEKLAAIEHERWSDWHRYSRLMATPKNIERWDRQAEIPYIALSREEQLSDLEQVDRYWHIISQIRSEAIQQTKREIVEKIKKEYVEEGEAMYENDPDKKLSEGFTDGYNKALDDLIKEIEK